MYDNDSEGEAHIQLNNVVHVLQEKLALWFYLFMN